MARELPGKLVPHLQSVSERMFGGKGPLDFWSADDERSIVNGFMDLAGLLELAELKGESPETWPNGYRMIMKIFSWEAWAQADGWSQYFEASDKKVAGVCSSYIFVGLREEADAVARARKVAEQGGEEAEVSAAHGESSHEYSDDLARLEYLAKWFQDNADFYLYKV